MRGTYDTPKRSHVIKTRLDDDEYKFFLLKCKAYGMNQSEMIRTSLDKLVINPVIKFSPVNKELLSKIDELITEGKRIGNNLNQIARAINSDSFDAGITTDIRRALGDLAEWKYEILQEVGSAIGNDQTFEKVQEIREQRHRRTKSGNSHMFSGLVFCADCKGRMSFSSANGDESKWYFTCSNSRGKDSPCTAHYIRVIVLERLVWHYTQRVIELVLRYEAHFRAIMEEKMQTESKAILKAKHKQLEKAEKRIQELDRLFVRTYEDNVSGKLSDDRFASMSQGYEEEQQDLKEAAKTLRKEIEVQEQQNQNLDLFIERVQKYTALEELTPYAAHELIKAIYVGAPDKSSGKRRQSVHIEYDLIGFIPLNELMKQETA